MHGEKTIKLNTYLFVLFVTRVFNKVRGNCYKTSVTKNPRLYFCNIGHKVLHYGIYIVRGGCRDFEKGCVFYVDHHGWLAKKNL